MDGISFSCVVDEGVSVGNWDKTVFYCGNERSLPDPLIKYRVCFAFLLFCLVLRGILGADSWDGKIGSGSFPFCTISVFS